MGRKKTNQSNKTNVVKQLQDKFGQIAAITYDSISSIETIPTGILALDRVLGGGVPVCRMIELLGDPSSGKTTLALTIAANAQKKFKDKHILYVDAEHALDLPWATKIGVDVTDRFIHSNPITGEEAFAIIEDALNSGEISVVIIDSVAALMPAAEKEKEIGEANIGLQARLIAQAIRRLNSLIPKHKDICIVFINQQRAQIGGGPASFSYGAFKKATGGLALPFYMTTRLKIVKIRSKFDADRNVIGQEVKVDVLKHKVLGGPGFKINFCIDNKTGIDLAQELLEWGIENKKIKKSGSWFTIENVKESFQGETSIKSYIKEHLLEEWTNEAS